MISKEAFKSLVDRVVKETGKSQEQLAIEMGYGKNYISELTTPSGTVSKKFLQAFKLKHKDILENPKTDKGVKNNGNRGTSVNQQINSNKGLGQVPAEELIQVLKEHNDFLRRNFELSLTGISVQAASILAYVSTSLEKDDEKEAAGDAEKLQQIRIDTGRRIGEKMGANVKTDMKIAGK